MVRDKDGKIDIFYAKHLTLIETVLQLETNVTGRRSVLCDCNKSYIYLLIISSWLGGGTESIGFQIVRLSPVTDSQATSPLLSPEIRVTD